jgi:hypothetical protein
MADHLTLDVRGVQRAAALMTPGEAEYLTESGYKGRTVRVFWYATTADLEPLRAKLRALARHLCSNGALKVTLTLQHIDGAPKPEGETDEVIARPGD